MPWILLLAVGGYFLWKKLTPESQKELESLAPSAVQDFAPAVMAPEPQDLGMGNASDGGGDGGGGGGALGPAPSPSPPSPSPAFAPPMLPSLPASAPPAAHAGSPVSQARLGLGSGQKRPVTPLPRISTPSVKLGWHR